MRNEIVDDIVRAERIATSQIENARAEGFEEIKQVEEKGKKDFIVLKDKLKKDKKEKIEKGIEKLDSEKKEKLEKYQEELKVIKENAEKKLDRAVEIVLREVLGKW